MRLFLLIVTFGFFVSTITYAQIYVPQDKKTQSTQSKKNPFLFNWFKKKPTIQTETVAPKNTRRTGAQNPKDVKTIAGMNQDPVEQEPISYRDQLPKRQDYLPSSAFDKLRDKSQCTQKERQILKSLEQYSAVYAKNFREAGAPAAARSKSYKEIEAFVNDPKGQQYLAHIFKKCEEGLLPNESRLR